MENRDNAIEIRHCSKSFKIVYDKPQTLKEKLVALGKGNRIDRKLVLDDINLNINKGETVALIGTNGCGKSTLLKLMTKILYPTKGTIETNGKLTSLLELGAGFHPDFTGRENIYFNASIFGLTRKEIEKRMQDIIDFSELGEFIDNPVRTYSSGMYMRLAFSIAINVDAEILLIDEILAVGDQHFQDKCFSKLAELGKSDKTIVIVSHDLNSVKRLCNRAIWIYKGKISGDGSPEEIIEKYLNQVAIDHHEKRKKIKIEDQIKDSYIGEINIDEPGENSELLLYDNKLRIHGWELSDCNNSTVEVMIDGVKCDGVFRTDRPDVLVVFEGRYGGDATNDQPGWEVVANIDSSLKGAHQITVISKSPQNTEIARKIRNFVVK